MRDRMRGWTVIPVLMLVSTGLLFSQTDPKSPYRRADSIALAYNNHELTDAFALTQKLTKDLATDKEKFRAIYRWICDNVISDVEMMQTNKAGRNELAGTPRFDQWNHSFYQGMIERLISQRETICTGYAWLVQQMARYAKIESVIINGYGRSAASNALGTPVANHTWNAVRLEGQWYVCDATWSSGIFDLSTGHFKKNFLSDYFLTDPDRFALNHYPLDTAWLMTSKYLSIEEFMQRPLVYGDFFRHSVELSYPDQFTIEIKKGDSATFGIQGDQKTLRGVRMTVARGGSNTGGTATGTLQGERNLHFSRQFKKRGHFVVHLMYGKEFLVSYRVIVV